MWEISLAGAGLWERTWSFSTLTCFSRVFYFGSEPVLSGIHTSLAGTPCGLEGQRGYQGSSALGSRQEEKMSPWETGGRGQGGKVGATCNLICLIGSGESCLFCFLMAFLLHRDFKGLDLEMAAFRCLLELEHFPLEYLPQRLT